MTRFSKDDRVKWVGNDSARGAKGTIEAVWAVTLEVAWDDGTRGKVLAEDLALDDTPDPIKVGDSVTRKVPGSIGKVEALDDTGFPRLADVRWSAEGRSFVPTDELVKVESPSWNDVEVNDRVTFEFRGEEFTTTAYLASGETRVMSHSTRSGRIRANFTLLSVEKPTPPLPGEGVVIQLKNSGTLAHRRRVNGLWINDRGSIYTDAEVQAIGWEVAS